VTIELTCRDNDAFLREVEVYSLSFNPQSNAFSMTYCQGDDWGQVMRCPIAAVPTSFRFQSGQVTIMFQHQTVADEFGDWLIETEAKVQNGFRTMRG
jgi:hypothetical protein